MFMHNKRLQYTVRVGETNPALASLLLEQFGGADGELAAAMRYFTQGLAEALGEIAHGGGELAVGTAELLKEQRCERGVGLADAHRVLPALVVHKHLHFSLLNG